MLDVVTEGRRRSCVRYLYTNVIIVLQIDAQSNLSPVLDTRQNNEKKKLSMLSQSGMPYDWCRLIPSVQNLESRRDHRALLARQS